MSLLDYAVPNACVQKHGAAVLKSVAFVEHFPRVASCLQFGVSVNYIVHDYIHNTALNPHDIAFA